MLKQWKRGAEDVMQCLVKCVVTVYHFYQEIAFYDSNLKPLKTFS